MSSKFLNIMLSVIIAVILGGMVFFGFRLWSEKKGEEPEPASFAGSFSPTPIVNKGKESQDRDAEMEAEVRAISAAAQAYAADHKGMYPESDFRNPCAGVRYCLKGVNINSKQKSYLDPIPQTAAHRLDYHYQADNVKKTYCVKTPHVLETDSSMLFQCTQAECARIPFQNSCG